MTRPLWLSPSEAGRRGVWLALLMALFTAAAAGVFWADSERDQAQLQQQALLRAEQRAMQLADALGGQIQALFGGIDVALLQLRREWTGNPAAFDPVARRILAALPAGSISHVAVVGADGLIAYNSLGTADSVSVADREHFQVHRGGADRLYVGKAVQSQLAAQWIFIVNRPLLDNGKFVGTMAIAVPNRYVAQRLAALNLEEKDVVALVHGDGSFLARSREPELAMGRSLPASRPFLSDRAAAQGQYRQAGELDGVVRIFAWQRLPEAGLVIAVGLAEETALAPLAAGRERERLVVGLLLAVALAAAMAIGTLLWRGARHQQAMERSERRYRALLECAPDAIFVTRSGRFTFLNPAALQLLGATSAEELLGQSVIDRVHPDWREVVRQRHATLMKDGRAVPPLVERYLRLDGGEIDVEVTASTYADEEGRGTQVIVRDISERLHAARALQQLADELEHRVEARTADLRAARDEAERANRAKSEFLSRMSHELRTPLNAILGFGQLLEMDLRDDGQTAQVRQILHAGQHLLALINDVLDLARIEAGHLNVSTEPVALQPLLADCLTLLHPQAQARQLSVAAPPSDDRRQVRADRTRLKQVLLNLLVNAVKYNRQGGSVVVRIKDQGADWQVCVDDTGPGLDASQQARLFVAFERLDAGRSAIEGTGIGLALSRRLVELMHGTIGVHSEPGRGSSFWVRLPKADGAPADAPPLPTPGTALAAPVPSPDRLDLLYIEDNPVNLLLVEHMVALRPQWQLLAAATPSLGLELARTRRPRLILLDIHLPEMDGWSVMRVLREDLATRHIPVVAVSAHAMPADLARGSAAGFADYLTKPLDLTRLLAVLDSHTTNTTHLTQATHVTQAT